MWQRLRASAGNLRMTAVGVRRGKAALSSGCKPHPATAALLKKVPENALDVEILQAFLERTGRERHRPGQRITVVVEGVADRFMVIEIAVGAAHDRRRVALREVRAGPEPIMTQLRHLRTRRNAAGF